jgi:hypothetical protein
MNYGITSRDYLRRAKACLDENKNSHLFYAAFEIRCGVEARMSEYLEVQQHISKKKKQGWQVAKLARNIEEAFRLGEKVAILKIVNKDTSEVELAVRYTPVRRRLRNMVEKLGNYLHSAKKHHDQDHPFWHKFRSELEEAVEELEWSTSGRLLGPLLKHKNKNTVNVMIELPTKDESELIKQYTVGSEAVLVVEYE